MEVVFRFRYATLDGFGLQLVREERDADSCPVVRLPDSGIGWEVLHGDGVGGARPNRVRALVPHGLDEVRCGIASTIRVTRFTPLLSVAMHERTANGPRTG